MKNSTAKCAKCGCSEDAEAIELTGLCFACGERKAIDSLMRDLRMSYGLRDASAGR